MVEPGASTENTSKKGDEQKAAVDGKVSKLVGCDVVLDPKQGGMWIDKSNNITLSFFKDGTDRISVKKDTDVTLITKGIKTGKLRVLKGDKDVTGEFGGNQSNIDWRRIPIIENVPKKSTDNDTPLLQLLGRNNQSKIIESIKVIKDYKTLERLKELEVMGKNPSTQSRREVLNTIIEMMNTVGGVGEAKELPQEKEDVITAK